MKLRMSGMFAVLVVGMVVAACGPQAQVQGVKSKVEAVVVQKIEGSNLKRLALSAEAAKRLDVQTTPVGTSPTGGTGQTVVPYSAIVYDPAGATWTYTSPEDLVFVRQEVKVDHIDDDLAILTAGPDRGTLVVTVGAAELWGVETGVGGGH
jgi:hypothetical protein